LLDALAEVLMTAKPFIPEDEEKTTNTDDERADTIPAPAAPAPKKRRGFAAMDRAAVRTLARKGGMSAHARGTAHRFTTEQAREAGRKGGRAPHRTRGRSAPAEPSTPTDGAHARSETHGLAQGGH
jgi:general stress protein YciG